VRAQTETTTQTQTQSLLEVTTETGRKHQIRAQLCKYLQMYLSTNTWVLIFVPFVIAHIGHPIVGDTKYDAPQRFRR
jgi:23S rRNA-/tRNA-specific pseudouridylate synthase